MNGVKKQYLALALTVPLFMASCGGGPTTTTPAPTAPAPVSNQQQTERLYGSWKFTYTILNTYTDGYKLRDLVVAPDAPNDYYLTGTNDYGGPVVAGYDSEHGVFSLLDLGDTIDQFYIFDFTAQNTVSGCSYFIEVSSGQMSGCYAMQGNRYSLSTNSVTRPLGSLNAQKLQAVQAKQDSASANVYAEYLKLKAHAGNE